VQTTLILFAGLPGSGKTTLARMVARELRLPLLAKDRVQRVLRDRELALENTGDGYHIILDQADEQLALGVSLILDAVFPLHHFRLVASDIADRHHARLAAIYCYCSDDRLWRERMEQRVQYVPDWKMATWADVVRVRSYYEPWGENALLIDSLNPPEDNFAAVIRHIQNATYRLYTPAQMAAASGDPS
jgi:predicted kinase